MYLYHVHVSHTCARYMLQLCLHMRSRAPVSRTCITYMCAIHVQLCLHMRSRVPVSRTRITYMCAIHTCIAVHLYHVHVSHTCTWYMCSYVYTCIAVLRVGIVYITQHMQHRRENTFLSVSSQDKITGELTCSQQVKWMNSLLTASETDHVRREALAADSIGSTSFFHLSCYLSLIHIWRCRRRG